MVGEMKILDQTGDSKIIWDSGNKDEVDAARETFNKLKKKGFTAFSVGAKGAKDKKVDEFDPEAEKLIMVPILQGG